LALETGYMARDMRCAVCGILLTAKVAKKAQSTQRKIN